MDFFFITLNDKYYVQNNQDLQHFRVTHKVTPVVLKIIQSIPGLMLQDVQWTKDLLF